MKLIFLPILFFRVFNYLKNAKKKILIIEGASWVFYSFIFLYFSRHIKNIFIIYKSHNIEYDLRSKKNNFIFKIISKYAENYVFNNSDICTVVSEIDKKKIYKYYNTKPIVFPNSIRKRSIITSSKKKIKKLPKKFIYFCGSYDYLPNKIAINFLLKKILPKIKKHRIFLVLSGGGKLKFKDDFFLNLKILPKNQIKILYKNCIALVAPITLGFGTKLKIIEAMCLGTNIITTRKGLEGINHPKINNIHIKSKETEIYRSIIYFFNQKKKFKLNNNLIKYYSMEHNTNLLIKKLNLSK